jgi:hypothetical protein
MEKFTNIKRKVKKNKNIKKKISNIKENKEPKVDKSEPSKFFSKLFESREMAHIFHLKVRGQMGSNAEHEALGDYYDDVLEIIDELVEVYQGQYEIVEEYDVIDTSDTNTKTSLEYFIDLGEFIKNTKNLAILEEDTHLHSIVDDILNLVYKTVYKLKYTK